MEQRRRGVVSGDENVSLGPGLRAAAVFSQHQVATDAPLLNKDGKDSSERELDAETQKLKRLVESLSGRPIRLTDIDAKTRDAEAPQLPAGQTGVVTQTVREYEYENTTFEVNAVLTFNNGESLTLNLEEFWQREFYRETSAQFVASGGELIDPLVLKLDGGPLSFTEARQNFDLNSDGNLDPIAFATGNTAYLALDKNKNGVIDNGSELFGTVTGDGFAELAVYDNDGNGFIDSGDSVFAELSLLRRSESGQDVSNTLKESGIGALYLGSVATPFALKDATNQHYAQVRSSSFYITDDKQAGLVAQVDMVV